MFAKNLLRYSRNSRKQKLSLTVFQTRYKKLTSLGKRQKLQRKKPENIRQLWNNLSRMLKTDLKLLLSMISALKIGLINLKSLLMLFQPVKSATKIMLTLFKMSTLRVNTGSLT